MWPLLPENPEDDVKFIRDFIKYPWETIAKGGGCEDKAILLVSMILYYRDNMADPHPERVL